MDLTKIKSCVFGDIIVQYYNENPIETIKMIRDQYADNPEMITEIIGQENLKFVFMLEDSLTVMASYADGKGTHILTIKELRERFKEETGGWRLAFFTELEQRGEAYTRLGAHYQLLKK